MPSRRVVARALLLCLLLLIIVSGRITYLELGRTFSSDPTVWEPEIAAFEASDRGSPPPTGAVLFVGSSSIRFWETLDEDMAPLVVLRRGFGGARLSDLIHFADRIILPYEPRAIVVHAGGNEMNDVPGSHYRSPDEAFADFEMLVRTIRVDLPNTPIYFLALRPSNRPDQRDAFLKRVRAASAVDPSLHYLDTSAPLALSDGRPNPELIRWDYVHLNAAGYQAWAPLVRERLMKDLGSSATGA